MEDKIASLKWRILFCLLCSLALQGPLLSTSTESRKSSPSRLQSAAGGGDAKEIQVLPPPLSDDIFPCSECHNPEMMEPNRERRELEMAHEEILLEHDEKNRWCLDCHDAGDRDKLRTASGALIDFTESYKLCGQCHGTKLRDWRAGVHGKRTGSWRGEKRYLLCVHCHDSHSPRFKPMKPDPAPRRPEELKP